LLFHKFLKQCPSNETTFTETVGNENQNTYTTQDDVAVMEDDQSDFNLDLHTNNLMIFEVNSEVNLADNIPDESTVQHVPITSTTVEIKVKSPTKLAIRNDWLRLQHFFFEF
jgi:beta-galactosidase beta subunit